MRSTCTAGVLDSLTVPNGKQAPPAELALQALLEAQHLTVNSKALEVHMGLTVQGQHTAIRPVSLYSGSRPTRAS